LELRMDDVATTHGRANFQLEEVGLIIPTSITAIFTSLSPGPHIASIWIKGGYSAGYGASA
jgi:hypothetical protein